MDPPPLALSANIQIDSREYALDALPDGYEVKSNLAIVGPTALTGRLVFRATGTLFEARPTITPKGDYLLMFPTITKDKPEGRCYYGGAKEKVNDLVAVRSSDRGKTWSGAGVRRTRPSVFAIPTTTDTTGPRCASSIRTTIPDSSGGRSCGCRKP